MKPTLPLSRSLILTGLCGFSLALLACRKADNEEAENSGPPPVIASELLSNRLSGYPGEVYRNQENSTIRWQPWTKETLDHAKSAQRLIFAVIAIPQQPDFQRILGILASDRETVDLINSHYVPVLIDGDASREMSLLTADLCAEIDRPVNLPLFLWMTHEANPVAWLPVTLGSNPSSVTELFGQSHTMVSQMWQDAASYVLKNSALDNANRRGRIEERKMTKVTSKQPAEDALRAVRQLASLYDPYSRSFDETGGLFPSSALELLSAAAAHPALPAETRERCLQTTRNLLQDLLPSPMFDPLDGGVFSARRGPTWDLPSFVRDCPSQSRVAVSLLAAHRATGDPLALERALGLIEFAGKNYATPDGLFTVGFTARTKPEHWMWNVEEIRRILPAEDAEWWIKASGMRGLGNLPSEADPQREYFRENTIKLTKSMAEMAAEEGQSLPAFSDRLDQIKSKLLNARQRRFGKIIRDQTAHAGATFRMVSAYAAAFSATGDETYRHQSVELLQRARKAFADGPRLRNFTVPAPDSIGAARAFTYALALQAVLDVAAITSDNQWLVWAEDLATTAAELFTGSGFLKECPDAAKLVDVPVTDLLMLFDDSTAGLISMSECRLAVLGRPLVASFSELATPLPIYVMERPVLHTDLLLATIARHYQVVAVLGPDISPGMKLAVERLPVRAFQRRAALPDDQVPAGAIKLILGENGDSRIVTSPQELADAVLPMAAK